MKQFLSIVALLVALASPALAAAPAGPLKLGVFPYLSPSQMVRQFEPLRQYLETTLGRPVDLASAPDFLSFVQRTQQGEYDLVVTALHKGRLAQKRDGWQVVAMSGQQTAAAILVRKDSVIARLEDLRGKRIAVGSRRSITYVLAEEELARRGIRLGRDMGVVETVTFSNVLQSVLAGTAEAGATPTLLWDSATHTTAEQRERLREIFRSPPPHPHSALVMASPGTVPATVERLRKALLGFGDTTAGRDFLHKSQLQAFIPPDEKALARGDAFIHALMKDRQEP